MRQLTTLLLPMALLSPMTMTHAMHPVSQLMAFDNGGAKPGDLEGIEAEGSHLALVSSRTADRSLAEASTGTFTSRPLPAPFPFIKAVPFWNVSTEGGGTVEIWARGWRSNAPIGEWIQVATWSRDGRHTVATTESGWLPPEPPEPAPVEDAAVQRTAPAGGTALADGLEQARQAAQHLPPVRLDEDTLRLTDAGDALQLRVVLRSAVDQSSPRLFTLGAALFPAPPAAPDLDPAKPDRTKRTPIVLDVPYRSQGWVDKKISRRVCGPTSLSMIMEYHGLPRPTHCVAQAAYDQTNDIFGNWSNLAAVGGEMGLRGEVVYGKWGSPEDSLRLLYEEIEAHRPFILSIAYKEGELDGAPVSKTAGHLVVVRGVDQNGNFFVNDPGGSNAEEGQLVYDRDQLLHAWRSGVIIRFSASKPEAPPTSSLKTSAP